MASLLLLACSATKVPSGGDRLPAIDRYDGPAYRVLRRALRERPGLGDRLTILILSAEHGLIPADRTIAYYDRRMTAARAAELRPQVEGALSALAPQVAGAELYIELGQAYQLALPVRWPGSSGARSCRWGHGGIGERLGQLRAWLWAQ